MKTYWKTFKSGTLEAKIDLVFFFFWFFLGVAAFWAHNTVLPYVYFISGIVLYYAETKKNKDIFFPFDIHRHHGTIKGTAKKDISIQEFLPANLLYITLFPIPFLLLYADYAMIGFYLIFSMGWHLGRLFRLP